MGGSSRSSARSWRATASSRPGTARFIDPHTLEIRRGRRDDPAERRTRPHRLWHASGAHARPCRSTASGSSTRTSCSSQDAAARAHRRRRRRHRARVRVHDHGARHQGHDHRAAAHDPRFVDREMIEALDYFMRQRGAIFRLGEKVVSVGERREGPRRGEPRERQGASTATPCSTPWAARRTRTCSTSRPPVWPPTTGADAGQRVLPDRRPRTSTRPAT